MHPKISVIVVSWNARELLRGFLASLERHAGGFISETIVVDNNSSDGSPEMVVSHFPSAKVIRCAKNLGFAAANNLGIREATGDFLALINSDVLVHAGCIQELLAFMNAHPTTAIVGPLVIGGDGQIQSTCRRLPSIWRLICRVLALDSVWPKSDLFSGRELNNLPMDRVSKVDVISGCFWLIRRSAIDRVGPLDERFFFYAEDVDWCKRFIANKWCIHFVPSARATHFGGGSSSNAPIRYSIEMLRANIAYWHKHHGVVGKYAYHSLSIIHHTTRLICRSLLALRSPSNATNSLKIREDRACLRWLFSGRES